MVPHVSITNIKSSTYGTKSVSSDTHSDQTSSVKIKPNNTRKYAPVGNMLAVWTAVDQGWWMDSSANLRSFGLQYSAGMSGWSITVCRTASGRTWRMQHSCLLQAVPRGVCTLPCRLLTSYQRECSYCETCLQQQHLRGTAVRCLQLFTAGPSAAVLGLLVFNTAASCNFARSVFCLASCVDTWVLT